jgi:hypothetical protein
MSLPPKGALLRIAACLVLLGFAVLIAIGKVTASSGGAALAVALIAVLVLIVTGDDVRQLLRRLQKVGALGVTLDFAAEAKEAAQGAGGAEAQEDEEPVDIISLRLRLEWKLVYIGQHLLPEGYSPFVTTGSLGRQKLLSKAQARTAARVLSLTKVDLAAVPGDQRDAFLKDANIVVTNIRGMVFRAVVRQTLQRAGWNMKSIRRPGWLPDYLATKDGRRVRVAPAFSDDKDSKIVQGARTRVRAQDPQVDRQVVVIHDASPHETRSDSPPVVKLRDLLPVMDGH